MRSHFDPECRYGQGCPPILLVMLLFLVFALASCGGGGGGGGGDTPPTVPSAPTGVSATAGQAEATINWTAVAGATSYNIYYSRTTGVTKATGTRIAGATSPNIVPGLTDGTPYYFVVTAVNAVGESPESSQVSATPNPVPPSPSGVSATGGPGEATIGWTAVAGATSYNIYYSTTSPVTKATGNRITGVTSPRTVTGLINGTTYYFVVTAVNAVGESVESSQVFATPSLAPPAPTNVTAAAGHGKVTINWSAVTGATSYNIYFSTTSPVTKTTYLDKLTGVTGSSRIVTGLANGSTYYFVVTAVNANGESAESSQVSAMPTPAPPSAPTGVSATAGYGEAAIDWSVVAGATSYNIYYSKTSPVTKTTYLDKLTVFTGSSGIVTGLANGSTYYFVVTAVNANGESLESSQVFATPTPAPPAAPTGVSATAGYGLATINWSPVVGAASYNIYYSTTSPVTKASPTKLTGVTTIPKAVTGLTIGTTYYFVVASVNAGGESALSSQVSAIISAEYIAIGDSITEGEFDDILWDGIGYEPILANLLATTIANEGVGGVKSAYGAANISSTLSKYPSAKYFLVLYGTNDSDPLGPPIPSGRGLNPGDPGYIGSYKDNMQKIISAIEASGKLPYLAKVLFVPSPASRDATIQEYNAVIDELVANGISVTPPDFYTYFKNNQGELADGLHPNGDGYQSMANLWDIALP